MRFYHPRAIDASGGFYHFFLDDGTKYDANTRHLVSSTRCVVNYAMAYRKFGDAEYLSAARHGLAFLRDVHWNPLTGGYTWQLQWKKGQETLDDGTNHCYGLAFVRVAYAHGLLAGIGEAREWVAETWQLMEQRCWDRDYGLYGDEASADWELKPYRGQNTNMHACEAMLAAYEASGDVKILDRAELLGSHITHWQAALANGLIWEHYHANWSVDWEYNDHDRSNFFRPRDFQRGHMAEWAKLRLILERHCSVSWLLPRAEQLFNIALEYAWDQENGGLYYGFGLEDAICDIDKYFWVQAESIAAAAFLAQRTAKTAYWDVYQRPWAYGWRYFVDHQHGAWWCILRADNQKYSNEKSPAGKVDYHTMGSCYEVINVLNNR